MITGDDVDDDDDNADDTDDDADDEGDEVTVMVLRRFLLSHVY